ncbi:hypothetical protein AVEN_209376-1 [Araneus ventricosus]|uniref:Uncharacterized protein n=1 Tax=Araneus ventricosus TaxID=182803 RepID=A0A4Y2DBY0_ARAVE|nr:hypothetical protein AVEN_209376-1 [Araneus ventricosus]
MAVTPDLSYPWPRTCDGEPVPQMGDGAPSVVCSFPSSHKRPNSDAMKLALLRYRRCITYSKAYTVLIYTSFPSHKRPNLDAMKLALLRYRRCITYSKAYTFIIYTSFPFHKRPNLDAMKLAHCCVIEDAYRTVKPIRFSFIRRFITVPSHSYSL